MELIARMVELVGSFAHRIGLFILGAVQLIVPAAAVPEDLAIPIGWLALLTVSLAVAEVAKKLTWVVVGVGWLLIVIRIAMAAVDA